MKRMSGGMVTGKFAIVLIMIPITRLFVRGLFTPGPSPVFGPINAVAGLVSLRLRQARPWQRAFKHVKKGQLS